MSSFTHVGNANQRRPALRTSFACHCVGSRHLLLTSKNISVSNVGPDYAVGAGYGALVSNNTRRFVEAEVASAIVTYGSGAIWRLGQLCRTT